VLENYLAPEFIGISESDLGAHGLYQLMRSMGTTLGIAHQRIGARSATTEESRLLDISRRGAVLTMDRTAYDNSGKAVEYGHHCYRPDLYNFNITLVNN
jgi:GntR family transcriptional regulator